jgi:hypothetical protein
MRRDVGLFKQYLGLRHYGLLELKQKGLAASLPQASGKDEYTRAC